jgi:hypothetical protein
MAMEPVRRELLEGVAADAKAENKPPRSPTSNGDCDSKLLPETWLTARGHDFRGKHKDSKGRTVWEVKCPFNEAHGWDACVTQDADGKPGFKCQHNGCAGNDWHAFKNKIGKPDPHHYDPPLLVGLPMGRIVLGEPTGTAGAGAGEQPKPTKPAFELPVPASKLVWQGSGNWIWEGMLNEGEITLLTALWKVGKTTLLSHLLKTLEVGGSFCGLEVRPARVLYISEEHANLWIERRDHLNLGDHVEFLLRPFKMKATWEQWGAFLEHVRQLCIGRSFQAVIVDTLSNLWPVRSENDACEVQAALMPLQHAIGTAGCLLNHHNRKSGGDEGTAARGSGALCAVADTIVEMWRYDAGNKKCCKRVLTGLGRHHETPKELVIELRLGGYVALGDPQETNRRDLELLIKERLPRQLPGISLKELEADWKEGKTPCPNHNVLNDVLHHGADTGLWVRTGEGKKGDPYRFHRVP